MRAMFYRALRPLRYSPAEIDEMELWQIGVLLDGDIDMAPRPPRLTVPLDPDADPTAGPVLASGDWFD